MVDDVRMALAELLRKAEAEPGLDVLREGVRVLAEAVMDLEVEQHVGAARHERTPERSGQRNGTRERAWDTRVGTVARLVVSDAHEGLRQAIAAVFHGAAWQRCRVHFARNALALVPKAVRALVAATIRTVFAQPTPEAARAQWRQVADGFRTRWPRLAARMDEAEAEVLAYLAFPAAHWRQLWSTNPLERLNKELKRRTDVVGIFPNADAAIRLVGALLAEQHDEWQVGRRYFSAASLALLDTGEDGPPLALAAA